MSILTVRKKNQVALPSTGIYYIIPTPKRWEFIEFVFDNVTYPDTMNHQDAWENEVIHYLGSAWEYTLNSPAKLTAHLLKLHIYGFPRGRISLLDGKRYVVLNGNNIIPEMKITKSAIEKAFGLHRPTWEFDQHEQVVADDKQAVREILKIKEDWRIAL